jgi:hypothetical protein
VRPFLPTLAALALLAPGLAAAHPCEAEVASLAARVTQLENLVAADLDAENQAASAGKLDPANFEALERRLGADQAELQLAWQRLLEAQESCNLLVAEERRAARAATWPRVAVDLKLAWAIPVGNVWGPGWAGPAAMSDLWTGAIPVEVGVRYRFTPSISAGAYLGWGPALLAATGPGGLSGTSGSDLRVGLEAVYQFAPGRPLGPWVGLGTGWEWTTYSGQGAGISVSGWEFLNVQAGLDVELSPMFVLGPYLGFVGGNYTNASATGSLQGWGGAITPDTRVFHGWFQLGIKGSATF